jgi:hypothetical protein
MVPTRGSVETGKGVDCATAKCGAKNGMASRATVEADLSKATPLLVLGPSRMQQESNPRVVKI